MKKEKKKAVRHKDTDFSVTNVPIFLYSASM